MKTASMEQIQANLGDYLDGSKPGPIVVTKKGKPAALLLAVKDKDELERLLLALSPTFRAIWEAAKKRFDAGQGIPHDEFWRQVEAGTKAKRKRDKSA